MLLLLLFAVPGGAVQGKPAARQTHLRSRVAKPFLFTHEAMAATWTLLLYSDDANRASEISDDAFDEVDRLEQLLSNYRDSSELSRINHDAATGPVTTDPEMMRFLTEAQSWSRASDGAFDITVGQLMRTWGFFRHQGKVPTATDLENARKRTGWNKMRLDSRAHTVQFLAPGVELDPGGIGKGFAVDAAVQLLRDEGVHAALLSAGGSTVYGLGAPPGRKGWRVTVPGPLPSTKVLSVVWLKNQSLSSADCSKKYFVSGGHTYCHIMDPRTMQPVEGRIQVSVVHPSATASDALSNVAFVLSPQRAFAVLRASAPETQALVVSDGKVRATCSVFHWQVPLDRRRCSVAHADVVQ